MKIGIISDIHEDIINLEKAFHLLERYSCDKIVCLGDIVGYSYFYNFEKSRDANKCLSLVKEKCDINLAGNHDIHAIEKLPIINNCFQYPENWYSIDIDERVKQSNDKVWTYADELPSDITKENRDFIDSLSYFNIYNHNEFNILFSHYLQPDFSGSITKPLIKGDDIIEHLDYMKANNCLIGFSGHTHIEGVRIGTKKGYKVKPFGKYKLKKETTIISVPAIAKGKQLSGFVIFDTESFEIQAIPLKTKLFGIL
jgi:predicted phosphodiesterase